MHTRILSAVVPLSALLATSLVCQGPTPKPYLFNVLAAQSDSSSTARVWVNTASRVYHCPGTRYYGATKSGRFMSELQAQQAGNRPAYGRPCAAPLRAAASGNGGAGELRVWVNTSSGVYHCPDSRYYGGTKRGRYMSETEARATGYRPAYDRPCS